MKTVPWPAVFLGLVLAASPAAAQKPQPDYLTPEEAELVRETQEPNKRVELFLRFADQRLRAFEIAMTPAPGQEPARPDALKDMLNNFIRALDDATETLDLPLQRGGADLRPARVTVIKRTDDLLKRLDHLKQTELGASEDLRPDLEDAVEATQELLDLAKTVPNEPIPPKSPAGVSASSPSEQEKPPAPGRPTLKRRKEDKPK